MDAVPLYALQLTNLTGFFIHDNNFAYFEATENFTSLGYTAGGANMTAISIEYSNNGISSPLFLYLSVLLFLPILYSRKFCLKNNICFTTNILLVTKPNIFFIIIFNY